MEIPLKFNVAEREKIEIKDDVKADELVQEVKDLEDEKTRLQMIAKNRIAAIQSQLNLKTQSLENEMDFIKSQLMAYTQNLKMKDTKTQRSYNLLSGKIVIKKSKSQLEHDNEKILTHLLENKDQLYIKQEPKLQWGEMKKDLEIKGNQIINKVTGEVLDIEGLSIKTTKETLEIK